MVTPSWIREFKILKSYFKENQNSKKLFFGTLSWINNLLSEAQKLFCLPINLREEAQYADQLDLQKSLPSPFCDSWGEWPSSVLCNFTVLSA